jgi:hypothetical protein
MTTPESNASSYLSSASGWELSTGHHLVRSTEQQTAHNSSLPKALSQPKQSVEPDVEEDSERRDPNPQEVDFVLLTCAPPAAPAESPDQLNQLPGSSETPAPEKPSGLASDSFPTDTTSSPKLEEGDPLDTLAAPAAPSSNSREAAGIAPSQIHVRDPLPRFDEFRRRQAGALELEAKEGKEDGQNVGDEEGLRKLETERLPQTTAPGSVQRPPPTPVMPIPRKSGEF